MSKYQFMGELFGAARRTCADPCHAPAKENNLSGGSDAGEDGNIKRDVKKSEMGPDQRTNPSPAQNNLPIVPVLAEPDKFSINAGEARESTCRDASRRRDPKAKHDSRGDGQTISDICANRHKGNVNSDIAFQSIKDRLTEQQNRVLKCLRDRPGGLIAEEIAEILGVTVNCISGRCSELKKAGKIKPIGKRLTRGRNPADVLVIA